jgi:hypothetical protein
VSYGTFDTEEELWDAYNGDYGEEAEAEADSIVEQLDAAGQIDWGEESQAAEPPEEEDPYQGFEQGYQAALEGEVDRLERELGRSLREGEISRIVERLPQGEIPDLVEKHADELKNPSRETRHEMMAAAANQVIEQRDAERTPVAPLEGGAA